MTFKDTVASDIKNVFMNPYEFGEIHTVNGVSMTCVIDGNEVIERSRKQKENGRIDGIYEKQVILYVSRADFGRMPAIGSCVTIDSGRYRVQDAIHEAGIYSIQLGAMKS